MLRQDDNWTVIVSRLDAESRQRALSEAESRRLEYALKQSGQSVTQRRIWTAQEDAMLKELSQSGMRHCDIALRLKRSVNAINFRVCAMGYGRG
jgi:hypothetical protein